MKRLLPILLLSSSLSFGAYQIIPESVSIGTSKPEASASLQLTGVTKGFIPNKVTTLQRDAITPTVTGLIVYNTTLNELQVYDGADWVSVGSNSGGGVDNWVTGTTYAVDDVVIESNKLYQAEIAHTSGTFATDLAANKWVQLANDVSSSTGILPIANGGTGSSTQNFVDLTNNQTVAGQKTFSSKMFLSELQAAGSAGVDIQNASGTQVANFGAGGGTGISLNGTSNIGAASADYVQIAGGTGASTLTATGSSSNVNINLVPKGTGVVNINSSSATALNLPNETASTILGLDASKNVTGLSTATYPNLTELSYLKGTTSSVQNQINAKFTLPSLTSGSVLFSNGSTISQDNAAFFWDSTNDRLGIGTVLPAAVTHFVGSSSGASATGLLLQNIASTTAGTGVSVDFTNTTSTSVLPAARIAGVRTNRAVASDTDLVFSTMSNSTLAERMRIMDNGNVGIGTTSPASRFHVSDGVGISSVFNSSLSISNLLNTGSTIKTFTNLFSSDSQSTRGIAQFIRTRGTTASPTAVAAEDFVGDLLFGAYDGAAVQNAAGLFAFVDGAVSSGVAPIRLSLVTGSSSAGRVERMVVKSTGNIGIGTSAPTEKLSIIGAYPGNDSTNGNFAVYDSGSVLRTKVTGNGAQSWFLNSGLGEAGSIRYSTPGNLPGLVFFNASGTGRSQIRQYSSTGGIGFGATTTGSDPGNQMVLDTSGNVGIGTSTPNANAILDVQSTTKAFMPPRQTTAQKNAVAFPTAGMVVYDSDQKGLSTYNGTAWTTTGPLSVTSKTANYTALYSDDVILGDATSGAFAVTLPTAVGNAGKVFYIKKTDSSGNAVTINTTSSQTIDGSTTNVIQTQYKTIQVVSNGSNWSIL
jgi:hypothetical protein